MSRHTSAKIPSPVQLDMEQEQELVEAFHLFDMNGDKMIAAEELHIVMQALSLDMGMEEI